MICSNRETDGVVGVKWLRKLLARPLARFTIKSEVKVEAGSCGDVQCWLMPKDEDPSLTPGPVKEGTLDDDARVVCN